MIHERTTLVLRKLLEATRKKAFNWQKDEHGDWYSAKLKDGEVSVRFLYFEATNQVGADRHVLEISMPGFRSFFASGTEGYHLILETLAEAFESWREATERCGDYAITLLDEVISESQRDE
jgi:hypothetical protein